MKKELNKGRLRYLASNVYELQSELKLKFKELLFELENVEKADVKNQILKNRILHNIKESEISMNNLYNNIKKL